MGGGNFGSVGSLLNTNTVEAFQALDRRAIISQAVQNLRDDVESGRVEENPERLNRFVLITFADLKKYKFIYWFAFPTIASCKTLAATAPTLLQQAFSAAQISSLHEQFSRNTQGVALVRSLGEGAVQLGSLSDGTKFFPAGEMVTVAIGDASTLEEHPGWNVRNLVYFLHYKWKLFQVRILLMRDHVSDKLLTQCRVLDLTLEAQAEESIVPGWEADAKNKAKPRSVNLASQMDPKKLLTTAVDLNLKLMKWRLAPEMKLDEIAGLKCLLLGSGTLGCNIARSLLGWGCRNISFVDSGRVSFSNPVRQTLFTFEDCLEGGLPKAEAAAAAVKRIFPECNVQGYALRIAMPGHPIPPSDLEKAREEHDRLLSLAREHDVIFLLTDSREARWLGTVMGASLGKIVINAALGFDTYLVMRHGNRTRGDCQLGCYFCNDVVAPTDSLRDRSLDQQCTVTRPGVSMMASSLAIELLVSLLHSPLLDSTPADTPASGATPNADNPVGLVPHQIRGFLGNYSNSLIVGHAYDRCSACSKPVLEGYLKEPWEFVLNACGNPTFLEDLTGLTEMKQEEVDWGFDDVDGNDSDFSMTDSEMEKST